MIVYGVQDFSDDSVSAKKEEVITVISKPSDWASFADGDITDQQFANRSDIFFLEAGQTSIKKIQLNLSF